MWSNYIICSHLFPEKSQRMNASAPPQSGGYASTTFSSPFFGFRAPPKKSNKERRKCCFGVLPSQAGGVYATFLKKSIRDRIKNYGIAFSSVDFRISILTTDVPILSSVISPSNTAFFNRSKIFICFSGV